MVNKLIGIIVLIAPLFFLNNLNAQTGKIVIHESPDVSEVVEKHRKVNEEVTKTDGFRIQIFSVSGAGSKNRAEMTRADFLNKFPNVNVYIVYNEPSYKVRVGDYRSQIEALQYLQLIKELYPNAFTVVDKVEVTAIVE